MYHFGYLIRDMLLSYFFAHPILWAIPWILQSLGYYFVLKKMGLNPYTAVLPFLAEREMCKVLMRRMRTFYRPFAVSVIFLAAAYYLGPFAGQGRLFLMAALFVYGVFLIRLYLRLTKSFEKSDFFFVGMFFFAPVFLLILGLGKSEYHPLDLKPLPKYGRLQTAIRRACFGILTAAEILSVSFGTVYIVNQAMTFPFLVEYELQEKNAAISKIDVKDSYIPRFEVVESGFVESLEPSREHFFPDHSNDKDVVVFAYIIGSNLEKQDGAATLNITQMIDATKQGKHLKFVLEVGGSKRWFTKGIEDGSYGRYEIENGKITKVMDLPSDTNLSEVEPLTDFLNWGKENYPADRYMLVFWDHGGGFTSGFGCDDINVTKPQNILTNTEIISAIDASGLKFDMIGFDACLMQDIELGALLEPYTDYYLGSEEIESDAGWYYTSAFGKLAKDPGIASEDFLEEMISSYDAYYALFAREEGPDILTLSAVDTTLAKPAYDKLNELWIRMTEAVQEDPKAFSLIGTAADNTYTFVDQNGIDLVDFLRTLDSVDFEDMIYPHEEFEDLIKRIQSCVLYRNENTYDGINGIAVTFPYNNMRTYNTSYVQFQSFALNDQSSLLSKIFSIMAYKQTEQFNAKEHLDYWQAIQNPVDFEAWQSDQLFVDYTQSEWYEAGFEEYDTSPAILDIPLSETEAGYRIELPDEAWAIMLDCQTMVFQQNKDGSKVYLGMDYIGEDDENGRPMVDFDGNWVHINGQVVYYEAQGIRESDQGDVYSGLVPAMLNGETEIILNIEWDADKNGNAMPEGRVAGYQYPQRALDEALMNSKGLMDLQAGDSLQFMFQTYDEQGNLISFEPSGKTILVTKQERLRVADSKVKPGTYVFSAVLTDIYQRFFDSEGVVVDIK